MARSKTPESPEAPLAASYRGWFLDYASYVILDRAVPNIDDGLKPVQRRILHTLWDMDDGRFHKVANIVGACMRFHPHGDVSIGAALVGLGQRGFLVEPQGNFGNILTGDEAAAARYIEARLTPLAREVLFNPKTTRWQLSYDGRNREPITLPAKFPLVLSSSWRERRASRSGFRPRSCRTISTTFAGRRSTTSRERPSAFIRIFPPEGSPIFRPTTTASAAARSRSAPGSRPRASSSSPSPSCPSA
jgi:hypothetical protein